MRRDERAQVGKVRSITPKRPRRTQTIDVLLFEGTGRSRSTGWDENGLSYVPARLKLIMAVDISNFQSKASTRTYIPVHLRVGPGENTEVPRRHSRFPRPEYRVADRFVRSAQHNLCKGVEGRTGPFGPSSSPWNESLAGDLMGEREREGEQHVGNLREHFGKQNKNRPPRLFAACDHPSHDPQGAADPLT